MKPETRAEDALKAAGGALQNANLDAINLAAKIDDGTQLFIPTKGSPAGSAGSDAYAATPTKGKAGSRGSSAHSAKLSRPGKEFVNINTASEDELQKLPG